MKWNREEKQKKLKNAESAHCNVKVAQFVYSSVRGVGVGWNKKHTLSLRHYTLWDHFRALRKAKKNTYIYSHVYSHIYTYVITL